jgi:hypothetical protein
VNRGKVDGLLVKQTIDAYLRATRFPTSFTFRGAANGDRRRRPRGSHAFEQLPELLDVRHGVRFDERNVPGSIPTGLSLK